MDAVAARLPGQALATGKEAVAFARNLSHPNSLASAEFFLNIVQMYRREARAFQEAAERLFAFPRSTGLAAGYSSRPPTGGGR